ncbi:hypothetical protein [Providencia sp. Je.9.19]|uniref:hypothetical protein n=1 Tax=Providencia sp. Je.9.19 TaxID=3142844 RepID=UPI003DA9E0C1
MKLSITKGAIFPTVIFITSCFLSVLFVPYSSAWDYKFWVTDGNVPPIPFEQRMMNISITELSVDETRVRYDIKPGWSSNFPFYNTGQCYLTMLRGNNLDNAIFPGHTQYKFPVISKSCSQVTNQEFYNLIMSVRDYSYLSDNASYITSGFSTMCVSYKVTSDSNWYSDYRYILPPICKFQAPPPDKTIPCEFSVSPNNYFSITTRNLAGRVFSIDLLPICKKEMSAKISMGDPNLKLYKSGDNAKTISTKSNFVVNGKDSGSVYQGNLKNGVSVKYDFTITDNPSSISLGEYSNNQIIILDYN